LEQGAHLNGYADETNLVPLWAGDDSRLGVHVRPADATQKASSVLCSGNLSRRAVDHSPRTVALSFVIRLPRLAVGRAVERSAASRTHPNPPSSVNHFSWKRHTRCHPDRSSNGLAAHPSIKNASVRQPLSLNSCPLLCHPERSRGICGSTDPSWKCFSTEQRDLRLTQPAANLAKNATPSLPSRRPRHTVGLAVGSADLAWKMACVTSYRVEARRANTRRQPSPDRGPRQLCCWGGEGLGDRRVADPSAIGAALFPPPQPDLGTNQ